MKCSHCGRRNRGRNLSFPFWPLLTLCAGCLTDASVQASKEPVIVVFNGRRLGLHGSHSIALARLREYPPDARVIRVRDGAQLSRVAVGGYLPRPSSGGMIGPGCNGGGCPDVDVIEVCA